MAFMFDYCLKHGGHGGLPFLGSVEQNWTFILQLNLRKKKERTNFP